MKIGKEVEGRFKGLLTLFMGADEALDFFNHPSLKTRIDNEQAKALIEKVRAIYVSDHENKITPIDDCIQIWESLGFVVCIERTRVDNAYNWPDHVSFLLVVEHPDVWRLRDTDQIKFSRNQTVLCATVESLVRTNPEDFAGDIEFKAYGGEDGA